MKFIKSIKSTYFIGMISVALLSVVISCFINIFIEYREFLSEANQIRTTYIDSQKEIIKNEVNKTVSYIEYMKSQAKRRLKKNIRARTNEAVAVALNIYNLNSNDKNRIDIETMIKDALRPIRFNQGRGYYFATDLNGIEQLFSDRPELEGKNLFGMKDPQGKLVIQDMINIAKTQKEGFYRYQWTKPNTKGKSFPKIAYIKLFEPLNWFFGTGEYVDDVEADIKNEVLQRIAKIRFGANGYIFVFSFDGVTLMHDTQRHLIGKNIWNMTDPNGVKVIQEARKAVENPDGAFIHYVWNKPSESKPSPKISFIKGIHEWEWMIGGGIYVDEVEKELSAKRTILFKKMKWEVTIKLLIFISLLGFIFPVAKIISNKLNKNLNTFSNFFRVSTTKFIKIDPDNVDISEFKGLVNTANHMIDEREQTELALKESEKRFRALHNASFGGIAIHDKGFILECNKGLSEISGYEYNELIGMNGLYLISDDTRDKVLQNINAGYEKPYEAMGIRKNGETYPLRLEARNIPYKGKNVRVVEFRDITEQKQAEAENARLEEQYRQAQKVDAIGRLAGGVAHDMNNLLTPILGYGEMLLDDFDPDDRRKRSVKQIVQAGYGCRDLVRQLLAFGRKQPLEYKPVDINKTIEGFEELLRRTIREDIAVEIIPSPDIQIVKADIGQIEQVIMNLSVNAQDAMPDGGRLTLETAMVAIDEDYAGGHPGTQAGQYVMLAVSDTGCGMDEETRGHIFEPFFSTKGEQGTGLGLATVHGIVKQHGGNIWVNSEPGKGTTFKVYLPISDEAHMGKRVREESIEDLSGSETILLVEDNEQVCDLSHAVLTKQGYTVLVAGNGAEALTLLASHDGPVHLLLTDVVMPGMNGKELFTKVTEKYPDLKVLYMSGYTNNVIAHHGVLDEGVQFIQKPFPAHGLATKVREVLEQD